MPSLVQLRKGKRYQFANTLVEYGEVIEVDARTRNRLVRSGYFIDVKDHERPDFIAMEEEDGPAQVQGGTNLEDFNSPDQTGAKPEPEVSSGPVGSRGKGKVHSRGNAEKVETAETAKGTQDESPAAESVEAPV